jgi:tetratricopeptide (TPR) repeat protein|nr:MAG TPA: type IV pilus biogenesis/stability protein PilW [Bacteriophage sp.]
MGPEVVNKNKNCVFNGSYAGHDLYITMYQDSEREFVVTHNSNIKPVSYFTGRETELQELSQRIEEGRKSVLVSGMGGIGKTHICRKLFEEYLNKHAGGENGPFRYLGYIEYSGDMGSSLQNCLKFKQQDSPEQNQEAAWKELEYLAADGKLLLFVDNVDKTLGADLGLQRLIGIPGAVVLTSRQASFSDEFEPYRVGFLGVEQCKEIYGKIRFEGSERKVNAEEVEDLEYVIENLAGRHTITVELLAHLARTKHWTIKRLREELEKKGFRLTFHKAGELVNIQESYEKLYDLSELTGAEQNVLEAFSVLPYIPLPTELCNQWLLLDARVSEDDDILMGLYQKGWLQVDWEQESYAMHPVFAQFIYEKRKPNAEKHAGLIEACRDCMEIPDSGSALECQKFIPFAEKIVEKLNMGKELEQIGFLSKFAYLLHYVGQYRETEKLFNSLLKIDRERWGENHPEVAIGYSNMGSVYEEQGEYEKAKGLYEKSLRIRERVLGEGHPDTARSYSKMGSVYEEQGEYEKAKELYEKSLRIHERVLGEGHPDTASIYNNLGLVYAAQREYEKAEELFEKSLRVYERIMGENHPYTATSCSCLASVYREQGKYVKAEELHQKSLRIRERALGENHPDTANSYNSLALVYKEQGEYAKAQELYEKSLRIREKMLGENHPETAISYNNLAVLYKNQSEYKDATTYYLRAYKIFKFKLGLLHSYTQFTYKNMEISYYKWNPEGNFDQWLEENMEKE